MTLTRFKIWGEQGPRSAVIGVLTTKKDGKARTQMRRGDFIAFHGLAESAPWRERELLGLHESFARVNCGKSANDSGKSGRLFVRLKQ